MEGELINPVAWMLGKQIEYRQRKTSTVYEAELIGIIDENTIEVRYQINRGHFGTGKRDLRRYEITAVAL